jgi:transcriptional regulator with XRE-family HTH domain
MLEKRPNPIDMHVGNVVRLRRRALSMSQSRLGELVGGITFQQIQKYESGRNRIGASRLQRIARVLGVSVGSFFEGVAEAPPPDPLLGWAEDLLRFLSSPEGLALNRAFVRITDVKLRRIIVDIVSAGSRIDREQSREESSVGRGRRARKAKQ